MDLYAEIKNFSFYENSGAVYINTKVIEKRVCSLPHTHKEKFEAVKVGEIISVKIERERILQEGKTSLEKIVNLLLNRFLVLKIIDWEPALQAYSNKSSPKFILSTAAQCGILQEK